MDSDLYYVRIERNIRGPFTRDALASMFGRGRVASDSQVSADRNYWVALRTLGDPFDDSNGTVAARQSGEVASTMASAVPQYFCSIDGETLGPLPIDALQRLVSKGRLEENDQVWQEGAPDWIAARSLPGLTFSTQSRRAISWVQANPAIAASVAFMLIALFGLPTYYVVAEARARNADQAARESQRIARENEERDAREREEKIARDRKLYEEQIQDLRMQFEVERAKAEANDRDKEATERRYKAQVQALRDQLDAARAKESAPTDAPKQ